MSFVFAQRKLVQLNCLSRHITTKNLLDAVKPCRAWNVWNGETVLTYRQVSNISHTLVGNKIIDHSQIVGASPVGAAPTTSSFST